MLDEAFLYIEKGLRIFPVEAYGKKPLTPNGFKDATLSADVARAWWDQWPDSNIGIAVPNGCMVLDVDGERGEQVLAEQGLLLPSSFEASTPRGRHYWYRLPSGVEVSPRVGLLPSIDIRSFGSYVVAPPSKGSGGGEYKWINPISKLEKATMAPDWLIETASNRRFEAEKIDPEKVLEGIPEGARDATLFRYACKLRSQGVTQSEAEILVGHAAAKCSPPFSAVQAKRKVTQAFKYPGAKEKEQVRIYSLSDLSKMRFEAPKWVIKDILPEGLALLVSGPKQGKSLLANLVALSHSAGIPFLGTYESVKGGVLYLDLEDPPRFAQGRWATLWGDSEFPESCLTAFRWNRMDDGGLDDIKRTLDERPEISLVVVDVLSNFWPEDLGDGGGGNQYHKEYGILSELVRFSEDYSVCTMLIHHDRKTQAGDKLMGVSGTRAMTGAAHTIWMLSREYESDDGKLFITGKHVKERTIHLSFQKDKLRWEPSR